MKKDRPLIGISVGDPAGIGPEITAKALASSEIYQLCRPLVVAETEMMRDAVRFSRTRFGNPYSIFSRGRFFPVRIS